MQALLGQMTMGFPVSRLPPATFLVCGLPRVFPALNPTFAHRPLAQENDR